MPILNKMSGAFPTALVYITVGTLVVIWTVVTMIFSPPASPFWPVGFLATGMALLLIGLLLGRIGRAARNAELLPPEVTSAAAVAEQNLAARAPIVATTPVAGASGTPGGAAPAMVPPVVAAPSAVPTGAQNTAPVAPVRAPSNLNQAY